MQSIKQSDLMCLNSSSQRAVKKQPLYGRGRLSSTCHVNRSQSVKVRLVSSGVVTSVWRYFRLKDEKAEQLRVMSETCVSKKQQHWKRGGNSPPKILWYIYGNLEKSQQRKRVPRGKCENNEKKSTKQERKPKRSSCSFSAVTDWSVGSEWSWYF